MKQITWSALLYETKPYRSKIIIAQFIALLAVIVSLPIPLLFPLLIDQVILDKPAELVAAMKTLFDRPFKIHCFCHSKTSLIPSGKGLCFGV
jgi:ABC-type bacteriocin/lantibiotic exporter with double-glycine peptidase domain